MGTKENPGKFDCYDAAEDNEPMFVLLARDPLAPVLVRQWANNRVITSTGDADNAKACEAMECAEAMEQWKYNKDNE